MPDSLARLRLICSALPEVEERPGQHTAFAVRGKTFAYHLMNHHSDRMVSLQVKAGPGVLGSLVDEDPERYFPPQFMAHHGWVGMRLDLLPVDWDRVAGLVEESYRLIAPKKLVSAVGRMAIGAALDAIDRLAPMRPVDPSQWDLSENAVRLREVFLALPEVEEREAWGNPTFRVGGNMFAHLRDRPAEALLEVWLRSTHEATALLVDSDPGTFSVPPYEGTRGWVAMRIEPAGDWGRVAGVIREAWRLAAPKRLANVAR